jgi:hypothetical protein
LVSCILLHLVNYFLFCFCRKKKANLNIGRGKKQRREIRIEEKRREEKRNTKTGYTRDKPQKQVLKATGHDDRCL